jgi:RNA ligase (TIGR02306 family)
MASSLIVEVCKIKEVKEHTNADSLEIAVVKGWNCIVKKDSYKAGDKIVYIPPDAILPIELADNLGVREYLSGKNKDRVRCTKLRGEVSEGLIIDITKEYTSWKVGTNVAEHYGITKYEPPVRILMGNSAREDPFFEKFTNIENIKNYPDIFEEGESVIVTEKIDGSNSRVGLSMKETFWSKHLPCIFSPKMEWKAGSHNVNRKRPTKNDKESNIYWFPAFQPEIKRLMEDVVETYKCKHAILYGELYGTVRGGLKDMHYGKPQTLSYVVFAIKVDGKYLDWDLVQCFCEMKAIPTVPVIAKMPYNFEKLKELCQGKSILADNNGVDQIREGIVIVSAEERSPKDISRATLKMLNPEYLAKKAKREGKGEVVDYKDE